MKLIYTGTLDLGHVREDLCINALLLALDYKYFCLGSALEFRMACFCQIFMSVTVLLSIYSVALVHLDKC